MNQNEKNKSEKKNSLTKINNLLIILESAKNSILKHPNFNLCEVLINEYQKVIPEKSANKRIEKTVKEAIAKKDAALLEAVIDAEIDRLETEKTRILCVRIIK